MAAPDAVLSKTHQARELEARRSTRKQGRLEIWKSKKSSTCVEIHEVGK